MSHSVNLEALRTLYNLKNLPRTGWLKRGVPVAAVETIAEHIALTSLISLIMSGRAKSRGVSMDFEKVIKMALIHDIAEALTTDVDRDLARLLESRGVRKEELSVSVGRSLLRDLIGEEGLELLLEYMELRSAEAKMVKAADLIERLIQAMLYAERYAGVKVDDLVSESLGSIAELSRELGGLLEEWLNELKHHSPGLITERDSDKGCPLEVNEKAFSHPKGAFSTEKP